MAAREPEVHPLPQRPLHDIVIAAQTQALTGDPNAALQRLLEDLRAWSGSSYGFLARVGRGEETGRLRSLSIACECHPHGRDAAPLDFRSLEARFGATLARGGTVIDAAADRDGAYVPALPCRATARRFLGMPLFGDGEWIGLLGLADHPDGYDAEIVQALGAKRDAIAALLAAARRRPHYDAYVLRSIADSMDNILYVKDLQERYVFVNRRTAELLGIPSEAWIGKTARELLSAEQAEHFEKHDRRVMQTLQPQTVEERIRAAGGGEHVVASSQFPLIDREGRPIGLCGISTDITEHKRALQDLRIRALVLENTVEAVCIATLDGRLVYSNPAQERMFGYEPGELLGQHAGVLNDLPPEENERFIDGIRNAVLRDGSWTGEFPNRRKDGTPFTTSARISYFEGDAGERLFVTVQEDMTERRRAEARLRESDERFQLVTRASNDAIWDVDLATGAVHRSGHYAEMFGEPEPDEDGWSFWVDRIHPDDRARADGSLRAAIDGTATRWSCEYRFLRRDGHWADIEDVGYIARDESGRATRVVGAMRDVTERKQAAAERDRLWNLGIDPICVTDAKGILRQVNPAWTRTLGWSAEELVGHHWSEFIHPDDMERSRAAAQSLLRGGSVTGVENRYRCRDGSWRWFSWNSFVISENGTMMGVVRDLTARRELEEQLAQSQKMEAIGRLAGGVAHDFNNVLTVIDGYGEMLLEDMDPSDPHRDAVAVMLDAGKRAAGLTAQLLAFSRKAIIEPRVVDVNQAAESSVRMLRRLIGEDVELATDFDPAVRPVRIDPGQLEQVILNLAVNARDSMPRGGVLRLATAHVELREDPSRDAGGQAPGRYCELRVSDTGVGMTDEVKRLVFEPFFTTKRAGEGTGLGLSTVYGIVRQAGGDITVESALGRGTTFRILLPAAEGTCEVAPPPPRIAAPGGTETVLVAEDEEAVRRLTRLGLEMQGYEVLEARSADEALQLAKEHDGPIHLLVTDVVMPATSGRELADAIRQERPGIRVLYMSGYTDDAVLRHGVEAAHDVLLQKPFALAALASKVRERLDAPR